MRSAYRSALLRVPDCSVRLVLHFLGGNILDILLLDQLDQCAGLTDVLEVRRHHRVQGSFDQTLDITKALDEQRSLLVVDVDHDRQRRRGSNASFVISEEPWSGSHRSGASRLRYKSVSG